MCFDAGSCVVFWFHCGIMVIVLVWLVVYCFTAYLRLMCCTVLWFWLTQVLCFTLWWLLECHVMCLWIKYLVHFCTTGISFHFKWTPFCCVPAFKRAAPCYRTIKLVLGSGTLSVCGRPCLNLIWTDQIGWLILFGYFYLFLRVMSCASDVSMTNWIYLWMF